MNSFFLFSAKFLEFLQFVENSGKKYLTPRSLDSRRREQESGGETVSLTRTENGAWTRTPTCYSRRPRRLLLDVPCGVEPPGHFARSGDASHHGFQQGSIGLQLFHTKRKSSTGNTFRQNFSLISSILIHFSIFSGPQQLPHFMQYNTFLKRSKIKIKMSISSSYLTTTAWEKFVEKYDDFMRNFKTKVKNEKRKKKLCFHIKW